MAVKLVELEGLGAVKLTKRRGTRRLRLRLSSRGEVVVSMPTWLPFKAGERFALDHINWISEHRVAPTLLLPNRSIGKTHKLRFAVAKDTKPSVKVTDSEVIVSVPIGLTVKSEVVQAAAIRGARKAMQAQAGILTERLESISKISKLKYKTARFGFMKSKWGSCRSDMTITLNYHLLDLQDELINYVIIHELVHTKHLNHSPKFWALVEGFVPNFKQLRKEVKKATLGW